MNHRKSDIYENFMLAKNLRFWVFIAGYYLVFISNCIAQKSFNEEIFEKYSRAKYEFEKFELVHGNFLQTRNTNMHYLTWGNPNDLPLVWVHGSFTNSYEIKDLAEKITKGNSSLNCV